MRTQLLLKLSLVMVASVANAEFAGVEDSVTRGRPDIGGQTSSLSNLIDCVYLLNEKGYPYSTNEIRNIAKPNPTDSPEKALILNAGTGENCRHCSGSERTAGLLLKSGVFTATYPQSVVDQKVKDVEYYVHMNITGTDAPNLFVTQMDGYLFSERMKRNSGSWGTEIFWPHINRDWKQNVEAERALYLDIEAKKAGAAQEAAMIARVQGILTGHFAGKKRGIYENYESYRSYIERERTDINNSMPKKIRNLEKEVAEQVDSMKRRSRSIHALELQLKNTAMNGLIRMSVERDVEARKLANEQATHDLRSLRNKLEDARLQLQTEVSEIPSEEARIAQLKSEADAKMAALRAELAPVCSAYVP